MTFINQTAFIKPVIFVAYRIIFILMLFLFYLSQVRELFEVLNETVIVPSWFVE